MTESIDPAIPLDTNESVEWSGRPRITTILPAVVIGVLLLVSGIVVSVTRDPALPRSRSTRVAIPVWKYFALQGVQYVITDEALYVKRGVLTRSVTQANLETVQNSSFGRISRDRSSDTAQLRSKSLVGTTSRSGRSRTLVQSGHSSIEQHRTTMVSVGTVDGNPVSLEICRSGSKFVTRSERFAALSESSSSGTARR